MIIEIKDGVIKNTSIKTDIYSQIEKGTMAKVNAIVVHQTGSSGSESAYSSYKSGQNGAHFLIEKDGTVVQTVRIRQNLP
ncbi:peptidoglycan recognition protein family protein [Limnobacter sp.]|uniref:peptidoglycan recognition protein family protein n=1 Tax=Limnobacter sp. TaxID=2003368 RepID=UPI002FE01910